MILLAERILPSVLSTTGFAILPISLFPKQLFHGKKYYLGRIAQPYLLKEQSEEYQVFQALLKEAEESRKAESKNKRIAELEEDKNEEKFNYIQKVGKHYKEECPILLVFTKAQKYLNIF